MNRIRATATRAVLWVAAVNLHALAVVITRFADGPHRATAMSLHLPVETVTQQLRTIEVLMQRIGRPTP